MKLNTMIPSLGAALVLASTLLGLNATTALAQNGKKTDKKPSAKHSKTVSEVKYKAHCGMIYSAADAKKNHYICPMDHKPLTKMVMKMDSGKSGKHKM